MYLGDEDTGNAFRVVSFRVGRPEQLLTFSLLKAIQEGWIQDVLQHLLKKKSGVYSFDPFKRDYNG